MDMEKRNRKGIEKEMDLNFNLQKRMAMDMEKFNKIGYNGMWQ
jgi:hypothetical protein